RQAGHELLAEVRDADRQLRELHGRIVAAVHAADTTVTNVYGVGPVVAAYLIGYTGDVTRFATKAHYARYNATAPLEASAGTTRPPTPAARRPTPRRSLKLPRDSKEATTPRADASARSAGPWARCRAWCRLAARQGTPPQAQPRAPPPTRSQALSRRAPRYER